MFQNLSFLGVAQWDYFVLFFFLSCFVNNLIFLSFFCGFRGPNPITGLSGCLISFLKNNFCLWVLWTCFQAWHCNPVTCRTLLRLVLCPQSIEGTMQEPWRVHNARERTSRSGVDFEIIPTNKISPVSCHWAGSFRFPPRARCFFCGRPAQPAILEATRPIPSYQPRTGYAALRYRSRCRWAWLWCLLGIISLPSLIEHIELPAKLPDYFLRSNKSNINQLVSFGKNRTNYDRGN